MTPLRALRALVLAAVVALLAGCDPAPLSAPGEPAPDAASLVAATLGGGAVEDFARALPPARLRFPRDHGPHPDFRSEWWYLTGNLDGASGRRYGFQLTFFRFALGPPGDPVPAAPSAWRSRQVWMAHFALSDPTGGRFHSRERFARGALGLAGASTPPLRVWLEDWHLSSVDADGAMFPLDLEAGDSQARLRLRLRAERPRVLQGEGGLSQKSGEPGNASYYYSYTRLAAEGELLRGDETDAVRGRAWLDREWSTSALAPDQQGWDWFALQLDDGRDLMLYRLRDASGGQHPASAGVLVSAQGQVQRLGSGDFELSPLAFEQVPGTGAYPVRWRVVVPEGELRLEVRPVMPGQHHDGTFRYYEGAVDVLGPQGPAGRGYLEMTPYPTPS